MAAVDELIDRIPLQRIAQQLGVNPAHARVLATQALPTLLAGMQANAQHPGGATSLAGALDQHDAGLLDRLDGLDPESLDLADGAKIVRHIFGGNESRIVGALASAVTGGSGGAGNESLVGRLLPMLAPIVMSWVSSQVSTELGAVPGLGGATATPTTPTTPTAPSVADAGADGASGAVGTSSLADLLTSAIGGAGTGSGSPLADILGGLLGGGAAGALDADGSDAAGSGLGALTDLGLDGDLLGSLLGGGTR